MSLKLGPLMKINVLCPLCKLPDMIINRKRKETQCDFHVTVFVLLYLYPVFKGELEIATIVQRALLLLLLTSLNAKALARIRFGQWIEPYAGYASN